MNKLYTCSIVMPVYNGASTIVETLSSLIRQKQYFDELIIINDASTDDSLALINSLLEKKGTGVRHHIINHKQGFGLAHAYNEGIKRSASDLIVTVHQDVILKEGALLALLQPFSQRDEKVVASYHIVDHPLDVWMGYNFWQKCLFSRLLNKKFAGLDGKFDCFRKKVFSQIGYFDEKNYRRAGEDGDMINRLKKVGQIVSTKAEIVHLHNKDENFGVRNIFYKQAQYSEAQGALLRRHFASTPLELVRAFFREILLAGLLIPYVRIASLLAIFYYSFSYSKNMFRYCYKDPRVILLPFINIALLVASLIYSIRGFATGRQRV